MKSLVTLIAVLVIVSLSVHVDAWFWGGSRRPPSNPRPPPSNPGPPPPRPTQRPFAPNPNPAPAPGPDPGNQPPPAPPKATPRPLPCSIANTTMEIVSRDCMMEDQSCDQHVALENGDGDTVYVFTFCDLADTSFDYATALARLVYTNCHNNRVQCTEGFECTDRLTVSRRDLAPFVLSFCLPAEGDPTFSDFRVRGSGNNRPPWQFPRLPEGGDVDVAVGDEDSDPDPEDDDTTDRVINIG